MFDLQPLRGLGKSSSVISTISLAAIFIVVIFNLSFISDVSLYTSTFKDDSTPDQPSNPGLRIKSTYIGKPLLSTKLEARDQEKDKSRKPIPSIREDVNKERADGYSERKLPDIEILKTDMKSGQFEYRAQEFFNKACELQFFMTWVAPARSFGRREFLALDSLFKAHPHGCLMILSRTLDSKSGRLMLKPLTGRGFRVLAVTPNLSFLFDKTPAATWLEDIKSGKKQPGEIPLAQNLSNLLRLTVLYKYGGIYIDTDFIILKGFAGLRNSIAAQSINRLGNWTRLNNAVLIFDKEHLLLYKFIKEFASTFDGNKWGQNGPYLVSRVVEREGRARGGLAIYNLTVLPPITFYPVDWTRVGGYFIRPQNRTASKWVEAKLLQMGRETYGVHLWNRESSKLRIEKGSIIGRLVSNHCIICRGVYSS